MSVWHPTKVKYKVLLKKLLFCIGFIFQIIDYLWPKDKKCIVFGSQMGQYMACSPKYVFNYMKLNHPEYNVHYYLPFQNCGYWSQIKYILRFAPIFFRAKVLISSHPPFDFVPFDFSSKKILINTWHGIPMKCMFFSDPGASEANLKEIMRVNKKTSFLLTSSSMEVSLLTRCFLQDPRKIVSIGHPRNDHLITGTSYKLLSEIIPNIPKYSTLILYCPTYRRNTPMRLFPFNDLNINHLKSYLDDREIVILTRAHVQSNLALDGVQVSRVVSRVIEFGQDVLPEINDILPEIDILITDYSSVYFDFLLCNKPLLFIPYDIDEYKHDVGILFDDYDFWTPGDKVFSYQGFIEAIDKILSGRDTFKSKREVVRDIFHYNQDENSSKKIIQLLSDLSGEKS